MPRRSLAAFALALLAAVPARAAVVEPQASIDVWTGGAYSGGRSVPITAFVEDGVTKYRIGTDASPWSWSLAGEMEVTISAVLDPDPSILAAVGIVDFGPASSFLFSWSTPIDPTGPAVQLKSSIGGGFTEGAGDGLSFIPDNPNAAGFALTSSLSGAGTVNPTLAIGPTFSGSGAAGTFFPYAHQVGYLPGPSGTWTSLGMALGFQLAGAGDAASLNVYTEVTAVPLPGAAALLASGLLALGGLARRARA